MSTDDMRAVEETLRTLTVKQHAALQMLMRGAKNREIAQHFNVSGSGRPAVQPLRTMSVRKF